MSDPVVLLSTGDVVGPAGGVTDNSMVLFSGTSGKLIKGNNAVVTAAGLALLDDVNAAAQKVTLGLGNVDNTSDVTKPISTATQTALNLKAPLASPLFTGDPKAPTAPPGTNTTQLATTAFVQASTPLNLKTSGIAGSFSNLKASATGTNATVTVTADSICLKNAANEQVVLNSVAVSPSLSASGAAGLDAGVSAINTWYSVWVIWNGTTASGLLSLSATAPTMPIGYTHKARIGWVRTDANASNKYPLAFTQAGNNVQRRVSAGTNVTAFPVMASGTIGTYGASSVTWAAIAIGNFVPTTAARLRGFALNAFGTTTSSAINVAPNNSFSGYSGANPPPILFGAGAGGSVQFDFALEGTNIYACSSGTTAVILMGWEDNI